MCKNFATSYRIYYLVVLHVTIVLLLTNLNVTRNQCFLDPLYRLLKSRRAFSHIATSNGREECAQSWRSARFIGRATLRNVHRPGKMRPRVPTTRIAHPVRARNVFSTFFMQLLHWEERCSWQCRRDVEAHTRYIISFDDVTLRPSCIANEQTCNAWKFLRT